MIAKRAPHTTTIVNAKQEHSMSARIIGNRLVISRRTYVAPIAKAQTRDEILARLAAQHDAAEKLHASGCRSGACHGCAS